MVLRWAFFRPPVYRHTRINRTGSGTSKARISSPRWTRSTGETQDDMPPVEHSSLIRQVGATHLHQLDLLLTADEIERLKVCDRRNPFTAWNACPQGFPIPTEHDNTLGLFPTHLSASNVRRR